MARHSPAEAAVILLFRALETIERYGFVSLAQNGAGTNSAGGRVAGYIALAALFGRYWGDSVMFAVYHRIRRAAVALWLRHYPEVTNDD